MLRECHRVLKPGGRLASVVIEPAPGLDRAALERARVLGPSSLTVEGSLAEHTAEAGFREIVSEDWTAELGVLLRTFLHGLQGHERELRGAEGDEVYEHELGKKRALLEGVDEGLLVRTLVVGVR